MMPSLRKQVSKCNEERVRVWFEKFGFSSEPLDVCNGKKGKNADWQFTKDNVTILCEVKTVFSGGQFGSMKEEGHQVFEQHLRDSLTSDTNLKDLPLYITIAIDRLHTPCGKERKDFYSWLKSYIRWTANYFDKNPHQSHIAREYVFGKRARSSPKAFVQIMRFDAEDQLNIGFIRGGTDYNTGAIKRNLDEAILQLRSSKSLLGSNSALFIIAFCSESNYLSFRSLFIERDEDTRYDLFDWAFAKYDDLAAILLLEYRTASSGRKSHDFWKRILTSLLSEWVDFGYLIASPYQEEKDVLRSIITDNSGVFIEGLRR